MKDTILQSVVPAAVGALGGLVRMMCARRDGQKCSLWLVVIEMVIAAFAGFLVNAIMTEIGASPNWRTVTVAIAGFSSREVLELLCRTVLATLKKVTDKIHKEEP